MLHRIAALPALAVFAPVRAPADGTYGTLGKSAVTAHEIEPGAITPDRLETQAESTLIGRAAGAGTGAPSALSAAQVRDMVDGVRDALTFNTRVSAANAHIPASVNAIRTHGNETPGDGGGADWVRDPDGVEAPGYFKTQDGAFWRLTTRPIAPQMFASGFDQVSWALMAQYISSEHARSKAAEATGEIIEGGWRSGFAVSPDIVDGRGAVFTLSGNVTIPEGVHLHNMKILSDRCTLQLGTTGTLPRNRFHLTAVEMVFIGTSDYSGAMLEIPNSAFSVIDETCNFDGGRGAARARYAVYLGREYGFGLSVTGGFRGGDCAIRIGRAEDQTSLVFEPQICDHGRFYNAIICNPKGARIKGDFEHVDGAISLAITSGTNGSPDTAEAIDISTGYSYNNSASSGGNADTVVLIGKDLPNTFNWDGTGANITSTPNTAKMINIHDMYMPSDHVDTCFDINALYGVNIERITWGDSAGQQVFARFSGECQETRLRSCRRQSDGLTVPPVISTAPNRILFSRSKLPFQPELSGVSTTAVLTLDVRQASVSLSDGEAHFTGWFQWSATTGGPQELRIALPDGFPPAENIRHAAAISTVGWSGVVQGYIAPGTDYIVLTDVTGQRLTLNDLPAGGQIHFSVNYPIDIAS
ncbi:hypothetical protein ACQ5SO_13905 [Rhodovulum sp. DZ06]|uniref:hypothetical protein n=1 Tax=Rhodovulum sp. DZ06 TaxID=3425126 RepID=UPI003D355BF2